MLNQTIETILAHRSVRKFTEQKLSDEQIETIVSCAQAASTSSFIQAYTIIGVIDEDKKKALAELAGPQEYVANNGYFLVFCADLHRHEVLGHMEQADIQDSLESTEKFMVSLVDTALAAQNAAIAAESMGLGICYIGGLRNNLTQVKEILQTPERVIPLFGMAIGYPAQETGKKPRLPLKAVFYENSYPDDGDIQKGLEEYNQTILNYYEERTKGKRSETWTSQMANMLSKSNRAYNRMYMKEFVQKQGFNLK
ncbi:MAG TPA: oxygen-insensitive NADPH nitroreductase [Chondromyces sp.]|nr:oxygen-insensitive NADPH nitroreductase [Chondromyces sp.]